MSLKDKYLEFKNKVSLAEKNREIVRSSKTWMEIRNLKKQKLALKDALNSSSFRS